MSDNLKIIAVFVSIICIVLATVITVVNAEPTNWSIYLMFCAILLKVER